MVSASNKNIDHYTKEGIIKTDRLNVRSFKVYADGALGSRGAAMKQPYSDQKNHFGALVTPLEDLRMIAKKIAASDYQMNTHAIGDSANYVMLTTYKDVLKGETNRRWRQLRSPGSPGALATSSTAQIEWIAKRSGGAL